MDSAAFGASGCGMSPITVSSGQAGKAGHLLQPAAMAIAFALLNPRVASVLFGATNPDQVSENLGAVELQSSMDEQTEADLRRIGA